MRIRLSRSAKQNTIGAPRQRADSLSLHLQLIDLQVGLRERNDLRQDINDPEVFDFVPLILYFSVHVHSVGSGVRPAIVYHICYQVVLAGLWLACFTCMKAPMRVGSL